MIKLVWNNLELLFSDIEWSGSSNQSSRQITFSIPANLYDKSMQKINIKLGEIVEMYSDSKRIFLGVITSREKSAEIGTTSYAAIDFLHYLLKSNGSYKFKNLTPEAITKKVCAEVGIGVTKLATTKKKIKKLYFDDQALYNIITKAYRKVSASTKKKYMLEMDGKKLSVIEKGIDSGVTLTQGVNITSATYSDTSDNMVNLVRIYNEKKKKIGKVENKSNVKTYGIYQGTYTKEKGVDAKKEASSMLVGITQEASIEAIGDIRAISGRSLMIEDSVTGLNGKFYIQSDTHQIENGTHTMTLELSWKNTMEEGAETDDEKKSKKKSKKKTIKKKKNGNAAAYYLKTGSVYHSIATCHSLSGKTPKKTTVAKLEKILLTRGKNKGKTKYRACKNCWK